MRIAGLAACVGLSVLSLLAPSAPSFAQADCKSVVATVAVRPGRSDRRDQPRHSCRHQGRRRGNPDRRGHADGKRSGRRRATVRHAVQQDHSDQLRRRAGRGIRQEQAERTWKTRISARAMSARISTAWAISASRTAIITRPPMGKYVTQNNLKRLGIENIKTFATRGVIIDAVKVFQAAGKLKANAACKNPCLDGGTVITEADLQAGLKLYNVTLREGDAVFINTGWGDLFQQFPAQNATYNRQRTRPQQVGGDLARVAEGRCRRRRHLGGRGDSGRGQGTKRSRCTRSC